MPASSEEAPDLRQGVRAADIPGNGLLQGVVDGEEVLLAVSGETCFAVGAHCTHYHAPLADGLIVGETIRCPWHHACFSLKDGRMVRAPALDDLPRWKVERRGDLLVVGEKLAQAEIRAADGTATAAEAHAASGRASTTSTRPVCHRSRRAPSFSKSRWRPSRRSRSGSTRTAV